MSYSGLLSYVEDLVVLNEPLRKEIKAEVAATKQADDDFKRRDLNKRKIVNKQIKVSLAHNRRTSPSRKPTSASVSKKQSSACCAR